MRPAAPEISPLRMLSQPTRRRGRCYLALLTLLAACGEPPPSWSVSHEEPGAALLAVLPVGDSVFAVGADDGAGPAVLRFDGERWSRLPTGVSGNLWWVTPEPDGTLLLVGEAGLVLTFDPASETFTAEASGSTATLFGAWVAADGTAYAVGGDVFATAGRGTLLVRRGGVWEPDPTAPVDLLDANVLYKVWGSSADDLWLVGERGTVLHSDGTAWSLVDSPVRTRLLTVHGNARGQVAAIGGAGNGVLIEWDGAAFVDRMPPYMPGCSGVFVQEDGGAAAACNQGFFLTRTAGGEWVLDDGLPTFQDLHAVAVDAEGTIWTVGGALLSPAFDRGVVLRFGR